MFEVMKSQYSNAYLKAIIGITFVSPYLYG